MNKYLNTTNDDDIQQQQQQEEEEASPTKKKAIRIAHLGHPAIHPQLCSSEFCCAEGRKLYSIYFFFFHNIRSPSMKPAGSFRFHYFSLSNINKK
jgi:hypothetical protein